jgi:hypothetical protein
MSQEVYVNRLLTSEKVFYITKVAMVQWSTETKYDEGNSKTNLEYIIQIPYNYTIPEPLDIPEPLATPEPLDIGSTGLPCTVW